MTAHEASAGLSLARELLALLHHLQGFAEGKALGSLLSPGAAAAPALGSAWQRHCKLMTAVGTTSPSLTVISKELHPFSSLPFFLAVTWKQMF